MNNNRKKFGWANTKAYPHKFHPARYQKIGNDEIIYLTFTHSPVVQYPNGRKVQTIPMNDNVSKRERDDNKRRGLRKGENISYAYPNVFRGNRSALGPETDEFSFIDLDRDLSYRLFNTLPVEFINKTGGIGHFSKNKKLR